MIATGAVSYDVGGQTMVGHVARPDGAGPWPAVLLAHDGIGLDDYQRARADDLARHGYIAFAMDYYGGGRTFFGDPQTMLAHALPLLADAQRMLAVGHAALDVLLAMPDVDRGHLAALGYGAGGRIVLELASHGVPFEATAVIHPALPEALAEDWEAARGAFLLCTGSEDPICPPDQLLAFARALQDAGADWRLNVYGGAQHAFWAEPRNDDGSPSGGDAHAGATVPGVGPHPQQAVRAWRAVLDLFAETIGTRA